MSSIYDGFDGLPGLRAWMTSHRRDCRGDS
jgi:hypothetical protein